MNAKARPLILVIDDEDDQRNRFQRVLTHFGYRVALAANGMDGLTAACAVRPALIMLDVNMPGMDGISCCRFFKSAPATREIPILLMTGLLLPEGVRTMVSSGLGGVPVLMKQDGMDKLRELVSSSIRGEKRPFDHSLDMRRFLRSGCEIVLNMKDRRISVDGLQLPPLAARRFDLLSELLEIDGVVSREKLLDRVWHGIDNLNLVDVTVSRLREDLKKVRVLIIATKDDGYIVVLRGPASRA